jgi:hypothetical protein
MRFQTAILFLLVMVPREARAVCINLGFEYVPSAVSFEGTSAGYSVYDPQEYLQTVSFQVRGEATGVTCEYFVTLSAGQSGNFSQRKMSEMTNILDYNAYTDAGKSNVFAAPPTATQGQVIAGSFPLGLSFTQTNTHEFYWTLKPQQVVPASHMRYADNNLTLNLYSGLLLSSPTLVDTKTITFETRVESSVDLSLVESGAPFDISETTQLVDFGTLESGEQRGFDVVVRSNDGYTVTMQSQNRQLLVHSRGYAIADTVPYSVIFNGGSVDLSTGAREQVFSGTGTTPVTGTAFPIEFVLGTLSGQEIAGAYSDVIDVEVTAN